MNQSSPAANVVGQPGIRYERRKKRVQCNILSEKEVQLTNEAAHRALKPRRPRLPSSTSSSGEHIKPQESQGRAISRKSRNPQV